MEELNQIKEAIDGLKMQRQVMEEYEKDYQNPKDVLNVENKKEKKVKNEEEDNPYIKR